MNYGGTGNQAVNTTYSADFKSDYQNKLLYNIFDAGVVNNYLDATISDVNGEVTTKTTYLTITWDNSSTGDVPIDFDSYVDIVLYKNKEAFYYIGQKVTNSGTYKFKIPTEIDLTGVYKLVVSGHTKTSYYVETPNWWIEATNNEYIKLRPVLSILIKPNNQYSTDSAISQYYLNLTDKRKGELNHQLIKSDTSDNIIIKLPSTLTGSGDAYVIAEFNWLETPKNSVIYSISKNPATWNQLGICKISYESGNITRIYTDNDGYYTNQTNSTIQSEGYINIDTLSGHNASNLKNDVPINNGILNVGLDAEKVDGHSINDLAIKNNTIVNNLNSNYLSSSLYRVGNNINNIPRSNTELNINLNVEMINGKTSSNFTSNSHFHDYNIDNILDGSIYKKLSGVENALATHNSFENGAFIQTKLDKNSFIRNATPLIITGTYDGTLTYGNDQFTISFDNNTFFNPPLVRLQPTFKNGTDYIKSIIKGTHTFTDYTITETEKYAGRSVKIIITDTGSISFIKEIDSEASNTWEVYISVDGPLNGNTTTSEMIVYYINTYSKMLTASWNFTNSTLDVGTFSCSGGSSEYRAKYIKAFPSNITQSGFVLNYQIFLENLTNNYLIKQTGTEEIYIHWVAIGSKL